MTDYLNELKAILNMLNLMISIETKIMETSDQTDKNYSLLKKIFNCLDKRVETIKTLVKDNNEREKLYLLSNIIVSANEEKR